jgi:hypothetical protein
MGDATKIRLFARAIPEDAIVKVPGDYRIAAREKPSVKPQRLRHIQTRRGAKVERPDRKQMEANGTTYAEGGKDLEPGIERRGACESHVAETKHAQAFVT